MRGAVVVVWWWCAAPALAGLADLLPPPLGRNLADLVQAAAATCEVLPLELLFSRHYTSELPHLQLVEFTRTSQRPLRALSAAARVSLGPREPLLLYIPGWWNSPTDDSSRALVSALLRNHSRVLVLDTRLSFCRGYISSASRVNALAHLLYAFIKKLTQSGVPLQSIHLIGFSLGAHVAGITGRLVQKGMRRQLEKITALDPAKPCFARPSNYRLGKRDAKFVQVIHSSAGVLGLEDPLGHTDVYMNGVYESQPECRDRSFTLECDHAQAWKMYAESVIDVGAFMGQRCRTWEEVRSGRCGGNATVLGYWCDEQTRGMFLYRSGLERKRDVQLRVFNPFSFFNLF